MENWEMSKLGFVNFWLYDNDEFPFRAGRLMLRGENGAGKSVTTQSFIPFMLDGDMRPTRLDSFGSKDRQMSYYLLGEDGEDSIGYLYLEFLKPVMGIYRTLVIGLHARRGKPMDFWGFCLGDGRRIGQMDGEFPLFRVHGQHRAALSKQECKNQLRSHDSWCEKSAEYKHMVNRIIFGYAEDEQYDKLLKLLIQIRKPKLSKDFSPTTVQEILNSSLQPLSENDIAPMISSMEKMDGIEERLANLRKSWEAASKLRNEYVRYNQFVLGKKAQRYLESKADADKKQLSLQQKQDDLQATQETLKIETAREKAAEETLENLRQQRSCLKDVDQLFNKEEKLNELNNDKKTAAAQMEAQKKDETGQQENLNRKQAQYEDSKRKYDDLAQDIAQRFADFCVMNETLQFDFHPATIAALQASKVEPLLLAAQKKVRQAAELLQNYEEMQKVSGNLELKREQANRTAVKKSQEQEQAEKILDNARTELCQALADLEDPSLPFSLTRQLFEQLAQLVQQYEGLAEGAQFQQILAARRDVLAAPIQAGIFAHNEEIKALQNEFNTLRQKKTELENQQELPPPRSQAVQQTRERLQSANNPCMAFYELVDFAPDVTPERRALLEAQLQDAGILDALVLSSDDYDDVQAAIKDHPDHFFFPESCIAAAKPIPLVPEQSRPEWKNVIAPLLQSISELPQGQLYFAADGRYRQGALRGNSIPQAEASYIGASARKANRQRQLAELTQAMDLKEAEIKASLVAVTLLQQQQQQLQEGYAELPSTSELGQALDILHEAQRNSHLAQTELDACEKQLTEHRAKQNKLRAAYLAITAQFPYPCTAADYQEIDSLFVDYRSQLLWLDSQNQLMEQRKSELERWVGDIIGWENQLFSAHERVTQSERVLRGIDAQIRSLTEFLNQPETKALVEQLHKIKQETTAAENARRVAHDKAIECRKDLDHIQSTLKEEQTACVEAIAKTEHLRAVFAEEYSKGPGQPGKEAQDIILAARKAQDGIRQADRGLALDALRTSLEKNVHTNSGDLADYRLEMAALFDSEDSVLRSRTVIQLHLNGGRVDLLAFIVRIKSQIEADEQILSQEDRRLFETILNETVMVQLRHRIDDSDEWVRQMSMIMEKLNSSMGLRFSLVWKGKPALQEEELSTSDLVTLLRKDPTILSDVDRQSVSAHFRAKVAKAREQSRQEDTALGYAELVRDALDFRNWFEFKLFYQKAGSNKKELTNSAFNSLSGGEKAMAMYVPLFTALASQYEKAESDSPRLLALDEAFAGVDDKNIESMFTLVHTLGFGYIMNSQALWGCYAAVPQLEIAELWRPQNATTVTIALYHWDGKMKWTENL